MLARPRVSRPRLARDGIRGVRGGSWRHAIGVILIYAAVSVLLVGRHAIADPQHTCACSAALDPPSYMWALRWWPYALTNGLNPLYSHFVWAPTGASVAGAALIPLPSLLMWPLTAAFGPLPAYSALTLLSPALAAGAMYFLCLHLTAQRLPSLAGGWLFGFSSYELSQMVGHANLMLIALLPALTLVVLLRLDHRIGRVPFVAAATVMFIAQALTSTEILATAVAFGAVTFLIAWLVAPKPKRRGLAVTALETLSAGVVAALIAAPYLIEALNAATKMRPFSPRIYVTDLASLVVPTPVNAVRYAHATYARLPPPNDPLEHGGYVGIPLLVAFIAALWELRRTAAALLLGAVSTIALVLSFGSRLSVAGDETIQLPWSAITRLPLGSAVIPDRLVLYLWFALAVAVAMWLAVPRPAALLRWAIVLVGVAMIWPDGGSHLFDSSPRLPALFAGHQYRRVLRPGSVVLVLPYGLRDDSMLWQAETDFAFRMPEGYLSTSVPRSFRKLIVHEMLTNDSPSLPPRELRAFITDHHVTTVLVDARASGTWPSQLSALGLKGREQNEVITYQVGTREERFTRHA